MYDWPPLKLTVDFIWIDFKFSNSSTKKQKVVSFTTFFERRKSQHSREWNKTALIQTKTTVMERTHSRENFGSYCVWVWHMFFLHCVRFTMNVMCHKCDVVSIDVQYTQFNIHINVQIVSSDCESITLSLSHQTHTSTRSTLLSSNFIHRAPK